LLSKKTDDKMQSSVIKLFEKIIYTLFIPKITSNCFV